MKISQLNRFTVWAVIFLFMVSVSGTPAVASGPVITFPQPPLLKGLLLNPVDPFAFTFILDTGHGDSDPADPVFETELLIKYFLASLSFPDDDLWGNLSPGQADRVIPERFGRTAMGRDLLTQDLELKRLTARLLDPASPTGREFWNRIENSAKPAGFTPDQARDILNRVWIVPGATRIYQKQTGAFILDTRLKVISRAQEQEPVGLDLLAAMAPDRSGVDGVFASTILPELEEAVNSAETFANLRQIYHSYILANWYKRRLWAMISDHPIRDGYLERRQDQGLGTPESTEPQEIYQAYLRAFQDGVSHRVIEQYEPEAQALVSRQYITGGIKLADHQTGTQENLPDIQPQGVFVALAGRFQGEEDPANSAMIAPEVALLEYTPEVELSLDSSTLNRVRDALNTPITDVTPGHELFHPYYLQLFMAHKQIVNPDDADKVLVAGAAGPDIGRILLSANATTMYFVDALGVSDARLRAAWQGWDTIEEVDGVEAHRDYKKIVGFSELYRLLGATTETVFMEELKLLGVDKTTVVIESDDASGAIRVDFIWAYPGTESRRYSVNFIKSKLEKADQHPVFQKVLEEGIDIYYQSASSSLPTQYSTYLPRILSAVRSNGFIMTDDVSWRPDTIELDPSRFLEDLNFVITRTVDDELLQDKENKINRIRVSQMVPKVNEHYALVNLRQKVARPARDAVTSADAAMSADSNVPTAARAVTYAQEKLLQSVLDGASTDPAHPGARQALRIIAGAGQARKVWNQDRDFVLESSSPRSHPDRPLAAVIQEVWQAVWEQDVVLRDEFRRKIMAPEPEDVLMQIGGSTDLMAQTIDGVYRPRWDRTRNLDIYFYLSETWVRESGIKPEHLGALRQSFRNLMNQRLAGGLTANPFVVSARHLLSSGVTLYHPDNVYFGGERVSRWLEGQIRRAPDSYAVKGLDRYQDLFRQAQAMAKSDPQKSAKRLLALSRWAGDDHSRETLFNLIVDKGERITTRDLGESFFALRPLFQIRNPSRDPEPRRLKADAAMSAWDEELFEYTPEVELALDSSTLERVGDALNTPITAAIPGHGLFHPDYLQLFMAHKQIVNPDDAEKVLVAGAAGPDVGRILLSANATRMYFVDYKGVQLQNLRAAWEQWDAITEAPHVDAHRDYKRIVGFSEVMLQTRATIESVFIEELKLLGVEKNAVVIDQDPSGTIKVAFIWAYPGAKPRQYSVTFIQTRLESADQNPVFKAVLEEGIDIFHQSASMELPQHYPLYMPRILSALKPKAFIMTDDVSSGLKMKNHEFDPSSSWEDPAYVMTRPVEYKLLQEKEDQINGIRASKMLPILGDHYALVKIRQKVARPPLVNFFSEERRSAEAPGGIDFDPRLLDWETVGEEDPLPPTFNSTFPPDFVAQPGLSEALSAQPAPISRLVPVIESVIPLSDVAGFLK